MLKHNQTNFRDFFRFNNHTLNNIDFNIDFTFFTGHIQISQVPDRSEPDDSGEINYKYIFRLLQKLGYPHWIGCEYTPTLGKD